MRRSGLDYDEILTALDSFNESRIKPPKPQRDLERIARSVSRYEPEPDWQAEESEAIGRGDADAGQVRANEPGDLLADHRAGREQQEVGHRRPS